jgi:hypothetical protein
MRRLTSELESVARRAPHRSIATDGLNSPRRPTSELTAPHPYGNQGCATDPQHAADKKLCVIIHAVIANDGEPRATIVIDCTHDTVFHCCLVCHATTVEIVGWAKP